MRNTELFVVFNKLTNDLLHAQTIMKNHTALWILHSCVIKKICLSITDERHKVTLWIKKLLTVKVEK